MEREVRYCTTEDGIRLAYCLEGDGPPLLVLPYFYESFAFEHLVPEHEAFMLRLGEGRRIIRCDQRGVGLARSDDVHISEDKLIADIDVVADSANLSRFSIWASTLSTRTALRYAATRPDRVARLVLYGSAPLDPTYSYSPDAARGLAELSKANWPLGAQLFADMTGEARIP